MTDEQQVEQPEITILVDLVKQLSDEFDVRCQERHNMGATQYGAFAFLGKDMMEEAMFEVLDLSNYARYSYIKMRMMQLQIAEHQKEFDEWRNQKVASMMNQERPQHGFTPSGG
jgi:hypothetical protein